MFNTSGKVFRFVFRYRVAWNIIVQTRFLDRLYPRDYLLCILAPVTYDLGGVWPSKALLRSMTYVV